MRVGLDITRFDFGGGSEGVARGVLQSAQAADELGFDSLWVMDHFLQIRYHGPSSDPMLEAYSTLGYMAGVTKRVRLGALVGGVTYRAPALVVKAVTTLDVLSGGRAYWGIGAGWNDEESRALGLLSPIGNSRFERLEETLRIAKLMWSGERKQFMGKHYQLEAAISSPQPVQKPHPPILIGGGGEQVTLRLVAQYGDACNFFVSAGVEHKLEVLRRHCDEVGRDYDAIEKTVSMSGTRIADAVSRPGETVAQAGQMRELGVTHVIFSNSPEGGREIIQAFAKTVLPELHKL